MTDVRTFLFMVVLCGSIAVAPFVWELYADLKERRTPPLPSTLPAHRRPVRLRSGDLRFATFGGHVAYDVDDNPWIGLHQVIIDETAPPVNYASKCIRYREHKRGGVDESVAVACLCCPMECKG